MPLRNTVRKLSSNWAIATPTLAAIAEPDITVPAIKVPNRAASASFFI